MNILIIGASGQVGHCLFNHLSPIHNVWGTYNKTKPSIYGNFFQFDLADPSNIENINVVPDVIFLTGSLTDVEFCEKNPGVSFQVNVEGVRRIADFAQRYKAKIIYYSSDYVFDGNLGLYREDDIPNPINVYGLHKLEAEQYIKDYCDNYLIIRTNLVYGIDPNKKNFLYQVVNNLRNNKKMFVPVDEWCTPTYNEYLANESIQLLSENKSIYHVVGTYPTTRYRFAQKIAFVFGLDTELIQPIRSRETSRIAIRPLNGGLQIKDSGVNPNDHFSFVLENLAKEGII